MVQFEGKIARVGWPTAKPSHCVWIFEALAEFKDMAHSAEAAKQLVICMKHSSP